MSWHRRGGTDAEVEIQGLKSRKFLDRGFSPPMGARVEQRRRGGIRRGSVGEGAEAFEEAAVTLEIGAEHFRNGQDVMAVGHGRQDAGGQEGGGGVDVFLVAGGAEPAAFAREGQEVFVDDLGDDGAQGAETGLVVVRVVCDERGEVAVGALPKGRAARVAGAIEVHGA